MSRALLFLLLLSATTLPLFGCGPGPSGVSGPGRVPDKPNGKDIRQRGAAEFVPFAAFSADDRLLLTAFWWEVGRERPARPHGLALWEVETGKRLWQRSQQELGGQASHLAFFPDGKHILLKVGDPVKVGSIHRLKVLDAADGAEVRTFDLEANPVSCLAVSPDGKTFLAGTVVGDVLLLDASTGKEIRRMVVDGVVTSVVFSPDGKQALAACRNAGATCLWDLDKGEAVRKFLVSDHWGGPAAFAPDGRYAVLTHMDPNAPPDALVVIGTGDGRAVHSLPDDWPEAVAFTADGKRLLSAGGSKGTRLTLREVDGGQEVWSVRADWSNGIALSPDAKYTLTPLGSDANRGTRIRLTIWDGATGEVLRTIDGGGTE